MVVVRETDGLLRKAGWDERDRVMQIYYPSPYRTMNKPRWVHDMSVISSFLLRIHNANTALAN